jgi:hypothetical protein
LLLHEKFSPENPSFEWLPAPGGRDGSDIAVAGLTR